MEKNHSNTENSGTSNYEFQSDAVEELVNADSGETPEYSQEELKKYRSKSGISIPDWLKILGIKFWFAGALCFFFVWGLSSYTVMLDLLFITAIVYGMVADILVNNVIRYLETEKGEFDGWMMFPKKGMMSFFLNLVYGCVIIYCVFSLYNGINTVITTITGDVENVPLGVEPILFGLFCMGFDMLFVGAKNLMKSIVRDAMEAAKGGNKK